MNRSPFSALTTDGVTLRGELLLPADPRAVVLVLHAMMVNRRAMDRPAGRGFATALAGHGFAVVNLDFRGHGESGPTAKEGAQYGYDDFVLRDVPAALAAVRERFPAMCLAVVGHSLGGHTTLIASGLFPDRAPDLLVMVAANLWLPSAEPSLLRRLQKRASLAAWRAFTRRRGLFDAPGLRLGSEAETLALVEQFAEFYVRDALMSRSGDVDYDAALARARVAVLSIASEGDRLFASPAAVRGFLHRAPGIALTEHVVRAGEILAHAPSHIGLVTDERSRPLWDHIGNFIGDFVATRALAAVRAKPP